MTVDALRGDEPEGDDVDPVDRYVGGDCAPFAQLCWGAFCDLADGAHLTPEERWSWLALVMEADYRTGVIANVTTSHVAAILGCSRPLVRRRLDRLEGAGLVVGRFTRGHPGWVAVVSYLEIVRVRPKHAQAIHDALAACQRGEQAKRGCCGSRSSTRGASDGRSVDKRDGLSLGPRVDKRPGQTAVSGDAEEVVAPSTSAPTAVGGRGRRSTSIGSREGTRVTRDQVCPGLSSGRSSVVVVPLPRRRRTEAQAVARLLNDPDFAGAVLVAS